MTESAHPRRKPIPDRIKVQVLLRMLGLKGKKINWSHEPALELRVIKGDGSDWEPPQHDVEFIFARTKEEHDHLTFEDNGTGRGDLTAIAHVRHVSAAQEAHQEEMRRKILAPTPREERPRSRWPKRRMRNG